ncbi:ABC transporter permease [Paenibacillus montanisoli]|uniref:Sugar ABC transporter permease n=1 Tax=Paenibacillus montanisoli TaxID=2081970 RepID=A0A328U7X3_9BACL|nr:ABC transporter permease subunit [Paenibacillus montanisoli]RAP77501.1 sugar ABC transporter permease [Paenibacillus montanisoli]
MTTANIERIQVDQSIKTRRNTFARKVRNSKYLILLFLPAGLYYLLFEYLPMFGILISFKQYSVFKGVWASDWVGLKYYTMFFQSPDFLKLLRNTFLLGFYSIVWGFPAPIILALLINEIRNSAFKRIVQTVSYLPHFVSNVIIVSMIVMFLSPSAGLINILIQKLGFEPIYFLINPDYFRTIFISSGIWQGIGWGTIIYLAALTTVDPALYETAEIDGASRWKKMIYVTLPSIVPVIIILFILNIGSLFATSFEKVFLLYNPLTYETADIIATFVYRTGLTKGNFSFATAIGVFNGILNFALLYIANFLARKFKEVSLW